MNLREALESKGFTVRGNKVSCPFHNDYHPSAILNQNSIYCTACASYFKLKDISQRLGIFIEWDKSGEGDKSVDYNRPNKDNKKVLFVY